MTTNQESTTTKAVARFAFPFPINKMVKLTKALETMYGPGLVIITEGPDYQPGWMTIAQRDDTP